MRADSRVTEGVIPMSDEEMVRSNVYLPEGPKQKVKERDDTTVSESCRNGLIIAARGEEIVEAERKSEIAREQLTETLSAIDEAIAELENDGANAFTLERVVGELDALRKEREESVERRIREWQQTASAEVAARESDPESVSVGAKKTPREAAEALVDDTGGVPDSYLREGPENVAVQNQAEKCGKDPTEFFEFVLGELDDSLLEIEGAGVRYDKRESIGNRAAGSGVATDGGERQ